MNGRVVVPGDKSISHRAVMLASLADGASRIRGFLEAGDTGRSVAMMRSLGTQIEETCPTELRVTGLGLRGFSQPEGVLDAGNSGTTLRIGAGLLAAQGFTTVVTGDASLRRRPMDRIIEPLERMGARVTGDGGLPFPPLSITGGRLGPIRYEPRMASAQVKSSVLLAGLFTSGPTTVVEPLPTRDHTERMLRAMGVRVESEGQEVTVHPPKSLTPLDIQVPGDFSAAAFFLVAAAVPGSELTLAGVGVNPLRIGLLRTLRKMGADIRLESERVMGGEPVADIHVTGRTLVGTDVGPEEVPALVDEVPALCVAGALAGGRTRITGAAELRVKESDRIGAMVAALSALGVPCGEYPDGLWLEGPARIRDGQSLDTRGDHRLAMALRVLAASTGTVMELSDTACVDTSFPGFEKTLASVVDR